MRNSKKPVLAVSLVFVLAFSVSCVSKRNIRPELLEGPGWTKVNNNLHRVDGPPPGAGRAFRVYRSAAPTKETFAKWCSEYNIERVIVLSGDADIHEFAYQAEGICTGIKVLYNVKQNLTPVSEGFLKWFDKQIEKAKEDRVGLLFRCVTGSHRVGRTAAYYQMKYMGLSAREAIAVMDHNGLLMPFFNPKLIPQVRAMDDYIHGRQCSQRKKSCVMENSNKWIENIGGIISRLRAVLSAS